MPREADLRLLDSGRLDFASNEQWELRCCMLIGLLETAELL